MNIALGILIGLSSGTIQFFLLSRFTGAVTTGKFTNKSLVFALTQFLLPFAVLIITAFFIPESLMWAGIGMGSALIGCAIVKFVITSKKNKSGQKTKTK